MFDEVTKREGARRAARRARYLVGAAAAQLAVVVAVVALSARMRANVTDGPLVPVRIVRMGSPASAAPGPPPPPRPKAVREVRPSPRREPRPSPASVVQPQEPPPRLAPPEPSPQPESGAEADGEGLEGGVQGGVHGGVAGSAGTAQGAGPAPFDSSMTPPALVSGPPLEYTRQALEREVEGVMVVDCVVGADGSVRACRVLKSLPFMDRAVVENLERRRYRPATLHGAALDVQYTFTIRLKLPR